MGFWDAFSEQAATYAAYRPHYPEALFEALEVRAPSLETAWDCGTGNGQAALGLAKYFDTVYATDVSKEQIAHALPHPKVRYSVAPAEASGLEDASVDVITVAQALHWFDLELFAEECARVGKPGALLAAWAYAFHRSGDAVLDRLILKIGQEILDPHWHDTVRHIWDGYARLEMPFQQLNVPQLNLSVEWSLPEFIGYMSSWSATPAYKRVHGRHPAEAVGDELLRAWGDPSQKRLLEAPLVLKVMRIG
jgi:SAM-dependent methyltransferase